MSMLYLVRHGQASAGTHNYDRLSPVGQRQSQLLGQWWADQGFTPHHTSHGSLERQRDTARLALSPLSLASESTEHSGLNEYDHRIIDALFGGGIESDNPESMTFADYVGLMQRWRDTPVNDLSDGAETWATFMQRGWQTVQSLHAQSDGQGTHVFFTSGGVIATLVATVLDLDFEHTIDAIWRIRNSSITTLHFDGNHARLVDFNTVPHLQMHHDPSLITLI